MKQQPGCPLSVIEQKLIYLLSVCVSIIHILNIICFYWHMARHQLHIIIINKCYIIFPRVLIIQIFLTTGLV